MNYLKRFSNWMSELTGRKWIAFHLADEILYVVVILLFVGLVVLTRYLLGW